MVRLMGNIRLDREAIALFDRASRADEMSAYVCVCLRLITIGDTDNPTLNYFGGFQ